MQNEKRKSVSKKLRFEIFKRDGFRCQYCGATPVEQTLQVDHVVSVASGGGNDQDNLITSCWPCNIGKGARDITVAPMPMERRAKDTAEREAQLAGFQEIFEAKRNRIEDETWRVIYILDEFAEKSGKTNKVWFSSAQMFVKKMGVHQVLDAAEIASAKFRFRSESRFRYFCGICWKMIRDSQSDAGSVK
jgi:DNA-directed RNA polymerase subunit RPC12/RpoP